MLKRILAAVGIGIVASSQAGPATGPGFAPYKNEAVNYIYNLLFCDNLELFRTGKDKQQTGENKQLRGPWTILLAEKPSYAELRSIADDKSQESRLRAVAYNRLREMKQPVPSKKLLGVIIEVGLDQGLDVLAAFPDGRIRYINHSEKMAIFETTSPEMKVRIRKVLDAAKTVVNRIGPWEKPRLAPPPNGTIRMSFLVSDGLYFGQGPMNTMERDTMAGPLVAASVELLQAVVKEGLKNQDSVAK